MIFGSFTKCHVPVGAKGRNGLGLGSCRTVWHEQDWPRGGWPQTEFTVLFGANIWGKKGTWALNRVFSLQRASESMLWAFARKAETDQSLKWAIPKSRVDSDYPGSNIIKKQIDDGVKTLRVGIKPETRVIARGNTKIFDQNDKEIGKVTSGTFGPSVECSIAMGYVENNYSPTNTKIFLEVRGKKVPANVCDLPFYKKNYVKGEKNVWN